MVLPKINWANCPQEYNLFSQSKANASKTFREINVQHDKLLVQKKACKSFLDGKNFVINHFYQCFLLYYTRNTYLFKEFGFLQNLLVQRCHLPSVLLGSSKPFWSLLSRKLRLLKK